MAVLRSKDAMTWIGEPPCSNRKKHTVAPVLYVDWHTWAARKAKTHRQTRCPGCGRFAIWVPKKRKVAK